MRTFLQAIIVAAVILGLSSCGMMMFTPKNKPQAGVVKQELKEEIKAEANAQSAQEVKEVPVDRAKLELQNSFDDVWMASIGVIKRSGLTMSADQRKGIIEARVQSAKVTVNMMKISAGVTDIEINAIKDDQPELELASEILAKIKGQLGR